MIKILFAMNSLLIITSLLFLAMGIKHFKKDEYDKKCIKCILGASSISGICIIMGAILFIPTFFPL
ncbi:hypothetical protein K9O30_15810 [Clostridium bowmanii]|uniref:hypothetical protein n=1 Tax=Clostridium bowmanii TaxID=132925 RepID=UPI001C0BE0E8|nr:hypothetical protein [Clostridium bowmanii]MBU3190929.1 hypothetical protein [Clostridium bowmanii]MCA1075165.1 hypothetical protein [Clostridium bowmanii]